MFLPCWPELLSAVYGEDCLDPAEHLPHQILIGLTVKCCVPDNPVHSSELIGQDHAGQARATGQRDLEFAAGYRVGDWTHRSQAGRYVKVAG